MKNPNPQSNVVIVGGEALNPTRRCKDAGDSSFSIPDLLFDGIGVPISVPLVGELTASLFLSTSFILVEMIRKTFFTKPI